MRVLVTGVCGFIAPYVARALFDEGHEVTCTDLSDREPRDLRGRFIGGVDLSSYEQCLHLLSVCAPEAICHLAAIGDVYKAAEEPGLAVQAGPLAVTRLLDAVCDLKLFTRMVYASTWEVYGTPRYQPLDEEHPCEPDHPYSVSKLAGEKMALWYQQRDGLPVVALRLGSAYGIGMRDRSVFSIFANRARQGQPLTINGDGKQFRQWTHVQDIARAFAIAATSEVTGVYNIVAPQPVTIAELAGRIADRYGAPLTYGPARPGDVPSALVSSDKAKAEIGWYPRRSFEFGLAELLSYEDWKVKEGRV